MQILYIGAPQKNELFRNAAIEGCACFRGKLMKIFLNYSTLLLIF